MSKVLSIGEKFPAFKKKAVVSLEHGKEFKEITNEDHIKDGKWMIMFWYPKDFTFVCPTEITGFNEKFEEEINKMGIKKISGKKILISNGNRLRVNEIYLK